MLTFISGFTSTISDGQTVDFKTFCLLYRLTESVPLFYRHWTQYFFFLYEVGISLSLSLIAIKHYLCLNTPKASTRSPLDTLATHFVTKYYHLSRNLKLSEIRFQRSCLNLNKTEESHSKFDHRLPLIVSSCFLKPRRITSESFIRKFILEMAFGAENK